MNIIIENSDFFEEGLSDVADVLLEVVQKEDRDFDDIRRIRNILDDLESFNITFILEEVDMITYTTLLSMRNISVGLVPNDISFKRVDFFNDELLEEYERLITLCVNIQRELVAKYNMTRKEIEYLEPNSRLLTVKVSASIKDLLYFFLSCAKYDENMEIIVSFSNDKLMEKLITIAMSINDLITVDDLFIRLKLDDDNREYLLDSVGENIRIISNEEYIDYCMKNNDYTVKLSTIGSCSMIAYRELVDNTPKQSIKIENLYDFIDQDQFRITLPNKYTNVDPDLANIIDGYIYDWFILVNNLKLEQGYEYSQMLCCLGCFNHIFKMNAPIYNYFELDIEELSEVEELMGLVQHKLLD